MRQGIGSNRYFGGSRDKSTPHLSEWYEVGESEAPTYPKVIRAHRKVVAEELDAGHGQADKST